MRRLAVKRCFIGCTYKVLALAAALSQTVNTVTSDHTVDTKSLHDLPNVAIL